MPHFHRRLNVTAELQLLADPLGGFSLALDCCNTCSLQLEPALPLKSSHLMQSWHAMLLEKRSCQACAGSACCGLCAAHISSLACASLREPSPKKPCCLQSLRQGSRKDARQQGSAQLPRHRLQYRQLHEGKPWFCSVGSYLMAH